MDMSDVPFPCGHAAMDLQRNGGHDCCPTPGLMHRTGEGDS